MKYIAFLLLFVFFLTGCGTKQQPAPTTQPQTQPQVQAQPEEPFAFEVTITGSSNSTGIAVAQLSDPALTAQFQWYLDEQPLPGAVQDFLCIPYSAQGKMLKVRATAQDFIAESQPLTVTERTTEEIPMASLIYDSKIYGRCGNNGMGVYLDYSASGVEMQVHSQGGEMRVDYIAGYNVYVAVFVDGVQVDRPLLETGAGTLSISLPEGDHRVMILKETEINSSGLSLQLLQMTLDGQVLEKPADRALYIEFIGDSISCGDGSLGQYVSGQKWSLQDHSGTHGFAYLTAQALDADWSVFARGGIGLMKPVGDYTAGQLFGYVNRYRDGVTAYTPQRIPDVVVIELGANDDKNDTAGFVAAYNALLDDVRALYGAAVKIVWVGKNMTQYESAQYVIGQRSDPNLFAFRYAYGESGSAALETQTAGHPSAAEQQELADALTKYLQQIL